MRALTYAGVFSSIAVLTVLAALPWGLPTDDRFFLPLLPVVAIHYWAMRRPERLPEWFVFLAGLALDVVSHGPLGYWPLVYLTAYTLGIVSEQAGHASFAARIVLFLAALAAVTIVSWALASIYFLEFADWVPYANGALFAAAAAIVLMPLLHLIDGPAGERDGVSLHRSA